MVKREKTAQYLSGFIYTDNNQSFPLPDGTRVTGRCQERAVCKSAAAYGPVGGTGDPVVVGDIIEGKKKSECTGICLDTTPQRNDLGHDNVFDCNANGGDFLSWSWVEAVIIPDAKDEFECLNKPKDTEWVSYPGSKYIESDFLPAEEWRRQIGFRWGKIATMTADGMFIPFSAQFRSTGVAACIKNACEDPQYETKTECEANGKRWEVTKLTGVCKDAADNEDPSYPTEEKPCTDAGHTWHSASDPDICKAKGGVSLSDPGDKFDSEIPKGSLPSFYSPVHIITPVLEFLHP